MTARICRWQDMERWTPDGGASWDAMFPMASLGDFLNRVLRPIDKTQRPLESLNVIAKITFGGQLHLRTPEQKQGYKGPLLEALPGELVISKIRVGQGSLCVVPDDLDHLAVSPEYPTYRPDFKQVRVRYLNLLLRAPQFQHLLRFSSSGNTTKKRIRPSDFEQVEVPLPEPKEQDRLLDAYEAVLSRAAKMEAEADAIEQRGLLAFEAALGLTPPPDLPRRLLQIAQFRDMGRWSHEAILQRDLLGDDPPESRFEIVPLEDFANVTYGIQKSPANRPGLHARPYLRVANVRRGGLDLQEIKHINVPDRDMSRLRLEPGDVLFVEGNGTRGELGRAAFWNGEIPDCVHQNHIIKARPDKRRADSEFIMEWFNTDAGRMHFFRNAKTTSGLGTLNSTDIRTAPVPLPDNLETQKRIVRALREARQRATKRREEALRLRDTAWNEFLAAVFQ